MMSFLLLIAGLHECFLKTVTFFGVNISLFFKVVFLRKSSYIQMKYGVSDLKELGIWFAMET